MTKQAGWQGGMHQAGIHQAGRCLSQAEREGGRFLPSVQVSRRRADQVPGIGILRAGRIFNKQMCGQVDIQTGTKHMGRQK
jgi:hypothetical protein